MREEEMIYLPCETTLSPFEYFCKCCKRRLRFTSQRRMFDKCAKCRKTL